MQRSIFAFAIIIAFSTGFSAEASCEGIHKKIDTLILAKKFDKAEKIALEAYKKCPNEPEAICALACVYRNKSYKSIVNIDLGAMGVKEGKTGTTSVSLDSNNIKKIFNEKSTFDTTLHKKAEGLYESIIKIAPTYENAYFNLLNDYVISNNFDRYFAIIDKFILNFKDDEFKKNSLIDLASKLALSEDVTIAITIRMYEKILKEYPDFSYAISDLAAMYMHQGEIKKAIPLFSKAYDLDKLDRITLANYVEALIFIEDFEKSYELSKALSKMDTISYYLTGMIGYLIKKPYLPYFDTFAVIRKSVINNPEKDFWYMNAIHYSNLDKSTNADNQNFIEFQIDNFNKAKMDAFSVVAGNIALKIGPSNFSLVTLGGIYDKKCDIEMTLKYLNLINKRRKIDSTIMTEHDLLSNFGRIYLVKNNYGKAMEYFLKANEFKKNDARLNYNLGLCCLGFNKKDDAIVYFKKNAKMEDKNQMEIINQSIWKLRELGVKE